MTIPVISAEDAAASLNGSSTCAANRCCGFELMNDTHGERPFENPFSNLKSAAAWAVRRPKQASFQVAQLLLRRAVSSGIIVRAVAVFEEFSRKTHPNS
jgi:hypothetical protein